MLLVPAYAVVVAAPSGPDQGCPSPRQINDALMTRIPAVVVPAYEASTPGVLRLTVSGGAGATPLRIELTDTGGEDRLYRNLTLAERGRSGDCQALAETVALIVDRFLRDLGYEAPPSPPPLALIRPSDNLVRGPPPAAARAASRFDLFVGGFWRGASLQQSDFEVDLGLGFERFVAGHRLAATLSGGVSSERSSNLEDGSNATLRRVPLRLGLFLPFALGPGSIEPGIRLAADWLFSSLSSTTETESHMRVSPGAEVVVGYRMNLVGRLFFRLVASVGMGVPYQFLTAAGSGGPSTTLFGEPRFYAKSGLELGFSFQ